MNSLLIFLVTSLVVLRAAVTSASDKTHHRSKRYFFINPDAPITLGFLLNMPISLALPTLVDTTFRSLDDNAETPDQQRSPNTEYPEHFFWDPAYEEQLGRLQVYFSYLKIQSVACQERLLCELAATPKVFSPLSELMLKELRQTHGPVKPSQESLFWRYVAASATGYAYSEEDCAQYYGICELPANHMLNMPVLKVWQYIASKLNFKLI